MPYTVFYTIDVKHFALQSLYEMCYTKKVLLLLLLLKPTEIDSENHMIKKWTWSNDLLRKCVGGVI